jgi:urea transport system permease protein
VRSQWFAKKSEPVILSEGFSLFYQYADSISLLMLSAVGLMIIFGMMGVINMAHGELMLIGAYTTSSSVKFSIFRPIEGRPRHFEPPGI